MAQGISELPLYSGIEFRIVIWVISTVSMIAFVMHARRPREERSAIQSGVSNWIRSRRAALHIDAEARARLRPAATSLVLVIFAPGDGVPCCRRPALRMVHHRDCGAVPGRGYCLRGGGTVDAAGNDGQLPQGRTGHDRRGAHHRHARGRSWWWPTTAKCWTRCCTVSPASSPSVHPVSRRPGDVRHAVRHQLLRPFRFRPGGPDHAHHGTACRRGGNHPADSGPGLPVRRRVDQSDPADLRGHHGGARDGADSLGEMVPLDAAAADLLLFRGAGPAGHRRTSSTTNKPPRRNHRRP